MKKKENLFIGLWVFLSVEPGDGLNSQSQGGPRHTLHASGATHFGNKNRYSWEMSLNHLISLEYT